MHVWDGDAKWFRCLMPMRSEVGISFESFAEWDLDGGISRCALDSSTKNGITQRLSPKRNVLQSVMYQRKIHHFPFKPPLIFHCWMEYVRNWWCKLWSGSQPGLEPCHIAGRWSYNVGAMTGPIKMISWFRTRRVQFLVDLWVSKTFYGWGARITLQ